MPDSVTTKLAGIITGAWLALMVSAYLLLPSIFYLRFGYWP